MNWLAMRKVLTDAANRAREQAEEWRISKNVSKDVEQHILCGDAATRNDGIAIALAHVVNAIDAGLKD